MPHYRDSPLVQKAVGDLEQMIENGELKAKETVRPALSAETEQEKTLEEVEKENMTAPPVREMPEDKKEPPQDEKEPPQVKKPGSRESVLKALRERQARLKEQEKSNERNNTKEHKKGDISL